MLEYIFPVSYTHLDVYKRQISNNNFDFFNKNYTTLIKSNFNIRVGTLFTCSFLVYFIYFVFGTYEKIIQPILENNIFFGG